MGARGSFSGRQIRTRNSKQSDTHFALGSRRQKPRNTALRIGNIRFQERYAEGEIPHNTKTGGGPFLLACSFPYVRDWLNKHPFKNTAEARLICNLQNGAPIKPDSLCTVMKQLRHRIIRMLECEAINSVKEKEKLEYLLRTKKWNPYCLRHSAITYDSDYLPEYAVKKKVFPGKASLVYE